MGNLGMELEEQNKKTTFSTVVVERCEKIKAVLAYKEKEYAQGGDRFHNFNVAARMDHTTPEKALRGMWLKHIVSVFDMVENPDCINKALVDEKIGDLINYAILLEGMFIQKIEGEK